MPVNLQFKYKGKFDIEIDFDYLVIHFSRSGSFKTCKQKKHQAEKAILRLCMKF